MRSHAGGFDYIYMQDGLGSVTEVTNWHGTVRRAYVHDSFGNIETQTGTLNPSNPFKYTGRELEEETGLYYYRARFYDPEIGRFLNEDPIGFAGGINFYAYVSNNPINFIDPWGLRECEPCDDCPGGAWLGGGFTGGGALGGAFSTSFYNITCDSNRSKKCNVIAQCTGVGGVGGGITIDTVVYKGCTCSDDLGGTSGFFSGFFGLGIVGGAGSVSGGSGGGFAPGGGDQSCGISFSIGGGIGAAMGLVTGGCTTTVLGCSN